MIIPSIYVLSTDLVHFLYFSSFYFSSFLMIVSINLKVLYSFLKSEYTNHIPLTFLLLSSPSHMWPPLVCPGFIVLLHLNYFTIPFKGTNMVFWTWLTSLKMMFFSSIPLPANEKLWLLLITHITYINLPTFIIFVSLILF
jgi:hypothetical protein